MRHLIPVLTALFLIAFSLSTTIAQVRESRVVGSFDEIKISGAMNVVLIKGEQEAVEIEAKNIDPSRILTRVEGNRLIISMKRGRYRNAHMSVYVTYRELTEIVSGGSGNVRAEDPIHATALRIANSGSGRMQFADLDAHELSVRLSGSSVIELAGRADEATVHISGSGNIKAYELLTSYGEVRISGSGNVHLSVSEAIDAAVSGSGNIRFRGNPYNTLVKTTGSGSIQEVN